jgi:hypothetical protein
MRLGNFRYFFAEIVLEVYIRKSGYFRDFFHFELATLIWVQNLSQKLTHLGYTPTLKFKYENVNRLCMPNME